MTKRVHRQQWRHFRRIAMVVAEWRSRQSRTRRRFYGHDTNIGTCNLVGNKRECQSGEVTTTPRTANHNIDLLLTNHSQLLLCLLADNRLVQHNVVQHATERIPCLALRIRHSRLDGLADSDTQAARRVGHLRQNRFAGLSLFARARNTFASPRLHHQPPERLLIEADPHHEHLTLQADQGTCETQRAAPLARTRFRRQTFNPELLIVPRLRNRRIGLVAAGRAHSLVLVVDMRRRSQRLLQSMSPVQRRGPPLIQYLQYLLRDIDPSILTDLLLDQVHRKNRSQHVGRDRVAVRPQRRLQRSWQIGCEIIPLPGDIFFIQKDLGLHCSTPCHRF